MNELPKIYFLVGMPGVGKSFYGKKASELLKMKFYDTDALIEENCKLSINEIFEKHGEKYFRDKESELIKKIIKNCVQNTIVATGGGTPVYNNLMNIMNKAGITVWLHSDVDFLVNNLKKQNITRPLIPRDTNLKENLEILYMQRTNIYAQSKLNIMINEGLTPILFTNRLLLSTFE